MRLSTGPFASLVSTRLPPVLPWAAWLAAGAWDGRVALQPTSIHPPHRAHTSACGTDPRCRRGLRGCGLPGFPMSRRTPRTRRRRSRRWPGCIRWTRARSRPLSSRWSRSAGTSSRRSRWRARASARFRHVGVPPAAVPAARPTPPARARRLLGHPCPVPPSARQASASTPVMSSMYICRPSPSDAESTTRRVPSGLTRGCRSQRHSPLKPAGEWKPPRSVRLPVAGL